MRELAFSVTKKDFRIEFFRAGGPGGQKQNKTSSACRITHIESGISAESRVHRSQLENKTEAFRKLVNSPKFKAWLYLRLNSLIEDPPEIVVEKQMARENLLIECQNADGEWVHIVD